MYFNKFLRNETRHLQEASRETEIVDIDDSMEGPSTDPSRVFTPTQRRRKSPPPPRTSTPRAVRRPDKYPVSAPEKRRKIKSSTVEVLKGGKKKKGDRKEGKYSGKNKDVSIRT